MAIAYQIATMRAWVKRRSDAHKPWNADELWQRIRHNWSTLSDDDAEQVFQAVGE